MKPLHTHERHISDLASGTTRPSTLSPSERSREWIWGNWGAGIAGMAPESKTTAMYQTGRSWVPLEDELIFSEGSSLIIERDPSQYWTPVQPNVLTTSYESVLRSGEIVRKHLETQFGATGIREQVQALIRMVEGLKSKLDKLNESIGLVYAISSFVPEPYEPTTAFNIVITGNEDDGFQASFLDANLHAYGETREEALENMKCVILETYHRLREVPDDRLGKSVLRQKRVLSHYVREVHKG